jgi:hypothetical protein
LRLIALSILFGGSVTIVAVAMMLVFSAVAEGIPKTQAATANAPIFIHFSKVLLGGGITLLIAEALSFSQSKNTAKSTLIRYVLSLLCVATTMIFALGIVPPMSEMLTIMHTKTNLSAEELTGLQSSFHRLHEISRLVVGGTILTALFSLLIPASMSQPAAGVPGITLDE